jgi:hypothetical protein
MLGGDLTPLACTYVLLNARVDNVIRSLFSLAYGMSVASSKRTPERVQITCCPILHKITSNYRISEIWFDEGDAFYKLQLPDFFLEFFPQLQREQKRPQCDRKTKFNPRE